MMEKHSCQTIDAQSAIVSRLRFPLILLVVYLHSYGEAAKDCQDSLWQLGSYEIVRTLVSNMIAHSAVPAFFFISGFLMFYCLDNYDIHVYKAKMRKRVSTLLIPYVLWNLVALMMWFVRQKSMGISTESIFTQYWYKGFLSCFWIFGVVGGANIDVLGNTTHLTIPANLPLWYLRDLIIVSTLSPVVYFGVKRGRHFFLLLLSMLYLSGIFQNLPGFSSTAVFFYSFGAYFSILKVDFSGFFHRALKPSIGIYVVLLIYLLFGYKTDYCILLFPLFRMMGVFVIFGVAEWAVRHAIPALPSFFAEGSFFVYVVHYVFFLSFVDQLVSVVLPATNELTHIMQYLICPLIKVCIYIGSFVVLKRLMPKTLSVLVGGR